MNRFFWVCLGGAAGTGARYLISGWALSVLGTSFPWGTLAVNVIGSFLIGAIMHVGLTTQVLSPMLRMALTTGVMGGFTTYSTFNYETTELLREGATSLALANLAVTLAVCLVTGFLGLAVGKWLTGR